MYLHTEPTCIYVFPIKHSTDTSTRSKKKSDVFLLLLHIAYSKTIIIFNNHKGNMDHNTFHNSRQS